jgi:hypothetical protein
MQTWPERMLSSMRPASERTTFSGFTGSLPRRSRSCCWSYRRRKSTPTLAGTSAGRKRRSSTWKAQIAGPIPYAGCGTVENALHFAGRPRSRPCRASRCRGTPSPVGIPPPFPGPLRSLPATSLGSFQGVGKFPKLAGQFLLVSPLLDRDAAAWLDLSAGRIGQNAGLPCGIFQRRECGQVHGETQ